MYRVREWLYIGDAQDAFDAGEAESVASVVTLHDKEIHSWKPYDTSSRAYHIPLIDGEENKQEDFDRAVETVLTAVEEHGEVLVHCAAGVSRSASVVATVLAIEENLSFKEALAEVRKAKSNVNPHPTLEKQAYAYLEEEHPFEKYISQDGE